MTDTMTPEQRHRCMSHIRSKATMPEMKVRRWLWSHGYRYRLNVKSVPGKPDIVLRAYRTAIFVNGCFWHGHDGCRYYTVPRTNTEFWVNKVSRNKQRDARVQQQLAAMGWHTITIWECELKPKNREKTLESLVFTLHRIFLQDHSVRRYSLPEDEPMMAAEDRDL